MYYTRNDFLMRLHFLVGYSGSKKANDIKNNVKTSVQRHEVSTFMLHFLDWEMLCHCYIF